MYTCKYIAAILYNIACCDLCPIIFYILTTIIDIETILWYIFVCL